MYPGDLLSGFNGPCIVNTLKNMSGGRGADNGPIPLRPPPAQLRASMGHYQANEVAIPPTWGNLWLSVPSCYYHTRPPPPCRGGIYKKVK